MAPTPHELLWRLSRKAMHDACQMHELVYELDHNLAPRPSRVPEETATVNLVRRLARAAAVSDNMQFHAILHTRSLEGGNNGPRPKKEEAGEDPADSSTATAKSPDTPTTAPKKSNGKDASKDSDPTQVMTKADLELTIKYGPNIYRNFALQAKSLRTTDHKPPRHAYLG